MKETGGSLDQRFAEAMGQLLGPDFPADIALAVSGGGDSMAMLTLAHNWAHAWGVRLWVVTVDHGLRAASAEEAALVAAECAALGWPHATLRWHWDGQGNLMDAARRARLSLIGHWRRGLAHVLFAHTRDDVAETFLMRLARGSGVEGLSTMAASVEMPVSDGAAPPARDVCWTAPPPEGSGPARLIRPCLEMGRAELRHYLRTLKGRWVEDPSNADDRFDRARMRRLLRGLEDEGLGVDRLAGTAARMARARVALGARAASVWQEIGREGRAGAAPTGDLLFERDGFERVERDTQLRLLAAALQWVSGAVYRPRAAPLEALLDRVLGGGGGTLSGCEIRMERSACHVFREYSAVQGMVVPQGADVLWDGRWRLSAAGTGGEIRALGPGGWQQVAERPTGAPPFAVARSLPALWQGETMVACDALGVGPGGTTTLWPMGREMRHFGRFLDSR
ncbi:tRNA lysidine(34) synthetase TilS [Pseudoponticoccus marisrubri]|uniref:tRNA(Ile)-lysidine synthase n=1 Tax=Pseudoponticoccus marisrubri TaxID=1685382 RepID=A0A0W7WGP7_9RHOB|nr:tRNA lysidine(34) synthetase TilS [Pseudoponticoccus marisrubri]KUF09819.1 tRNA(Ile)-lysidine synthetase [Pseudoponticoccus marisrubri]